MSKPTAKKYGRKSTTQTPSRFASLPILEMGGGRPGKSFDTDLVFVFQDAGKKAAPPKGPYSALVEKLRSGQAFVARSGSIQFVRLGGKEGAENVLLVGMGPASELTEEKSRVAGGLVWARIQAEKAPTVRVRADGIKRDFLAAFIEGTVLSAYQFNSHKSRKPDAAPQVRVTLATTDSSLARHFDAELDRLTALGQAVTITRDWSNQPSNFGTPEFYAAEARKWAQELGLKCTILDEQAAAREKMDLYLAVGQGSEREGRIVVLEHNPRGAKKTIALVGKGITFDSGGISIKPALRMEEMKHDMTGAATVMGAMYLLSKLQCPNRVVAVMAFTENMPSGNALQPGNVISTRAGKTVEIFNTDAEGRLILADALDYAQDFAPDAIIDVATLTGAVSVALGKYRCGLLGNNDELISAIISSGEHCGEKFWQLPLDDEYFEDLKSETADMKNSANDAGAGTVRGAIFLKQFIKKNTPWAHLDIAGTAYNAGHLAYLPKRGANGQFVRTLARVASDF